MRRRPSAQDAGDPDRTADSKRCRQITERRCEGDEEKREERVPESELRNFAEPEDRRRRPFAAAPERGNESGESRKRDRERRDREEKGRLRDHARMLGVKRRIHARMSGR